MASVNVNGYSPITIYTNGSGFASWFENAVNINLNEYPGIYSTTNNSYSNLFMYSVNLVSVSNLNKYTESITNTFKHCTNLIQAPIIPDSVTNMGYTFYDCTNLTTVPTLPNSLVQMPYCFYYCKNLTYVPTIPNSVTSLRFTFRGCISLKDAPNIENTNITDMAGAFWDCTNLVNVSNLPNSVINAQATFYGCSNLVTAPVIHSSVKTAVRIFEDCTKLTGNITIYSENITNADNAFRGTSLQKNVYIPFTYDNGVNTKTYNAFTSAGYTTTGTVNGVYLKDIRGN